MEYPEHDQQMDKYTGNGMSNEGFTKQLSIYPTPALEWSSPKLKVIGCSPSVE